MKAKKCAIVMDEVDGMSSDRGGITSLIQFIKNAKQPIICICNDRDHPKMRTLASNCLDLQFKPPNLPNIKKLLKRVQATVNMYREENSPFFDLPDDHTLQVLTDTCKGDIRQILNHIQLWYKQLGQKNIKGITKKDLDNSMNVNDAAMVLLNANQYVHPVHKINKLKSKNQNKILLQKLNRLTFVNYELMPFYFLENHLQLPGIVGGFNRGSFLKKRFGGNNDVKSCGFKKVM